MGLECDAPNIGICNKTAASAILRFEETKPSHVNGVMSSNSGVATRAQSAVQRQLMRFDRVLLYLRCLSHDRKCRWHLAGVWRELRLRELMASLNPLSAGDPAKLSRNNRSIVHMVKLVVHSSFR
jgi:hypothetical protein